CIHVLWRGTFVQIAEESDYRALDVSGKIYRRRIACAHGLPHAPAVENRARREPGVGHRAHPGHAPAPAVAHDADTIGAHVLRAREQVLGRAEARRIPLVPNSPTIPFPSPLT